MNNFNMKYWIIKDTNFGYRYTTNKNTRRILLDYFDDYLYNLLLSKGSKSDKLIIVGGLFSNTNPSIVAITDAYNCISKLSNIINITLITTEKDIRLFDGKNYTTLSLLKSIPNIETIHSDDIIDYNNFTINSETGFIDTKSQYIKIPNTIQFEKDNDSAGIFIINEKGKYIIHPNNFSPKHETFIINKFSDFDCIEETNNLIHLEIDGSLLEENKQLVNVNLFRIKPLSVKYVDINNIKEDDNIIIKSNFNIVDVINDSIKDNVKVKTQFDRILNIYKNTTKLT